MKQRELILMSALAALLSSVGGALAYAKGLRGVELAATLATFVLLISGYCLFSVPLVVETLRKRFREYPSILWAAAAALLSPYLIFAFGTNSFNRDGAVRLLAFIGVPVLLIYLRRSREQRMGFFDALAILAIWLPFDFRTLKNVWIGTVTYGFNTLLAVNLALILFVCYRAIEGVGYNFRPSAKIFKESMINFFIFAPIAITVGLASGFIVWAPQWRGPLPVFLSTLGIFLFIAIPEELLFRGLIQNFLAKTLGNEWTALIIASVIFGASHLNNAPYPRNLIYFLLATIAGFFYGRAYLGAGSLLASAITHTLVDSVWHELFK